MRRWIFILLIIAFFVLVFRRRAEVEQFALTISHGRWQYVLFAMLCQVIYYLCYALAYQSAFAVVDVESHIWNLIPLTFSAVFMNVIAPSLGASSATLFVDDARRRGQPAGAATVGVLLQGIIYLISFLLVLVAGLAYLFLRNHLQFFEIVATLALLAMIVVLLGVLALGYWKPAGLKNLLELAARVTNRIAAKFKRPTLLSEDWAEQHTRDFVLAAAAIARHPALLLRTIGFTLVSQLVNILCLWLLFQAFNQPITLGPLVAGYAVGILFWIVSITPQGIGVVEGVMTLVYTSLGIPASVATTVTLTFRGLSFWLPFTIGFFLLRRIKTFETDR
jgi:glycosyltransferase 2 family protein